MKRAALGVFVLLGVGCGLPPEPLGPGETCAAAQDLAPGQLGIAHVSVDTRGLPPGHLMAALCDVALVAPEAFVRVVTPGRAGTQVSMWISTGGPGTAVDFATELAVVEGCPPDPEAELRCGSPIPGSRHASLSMVRPAGETFWVGVSASSYAEFEEPPLPLSGVADVTIESREVHAPSLESATVSLDDLGWLRVRVRGEDVDADVSGVEVLFVDTAGVPLPELPELAPRPYYAEFSLDASGSRRFDTSASGAVETVATRGAWALVRLNDELGLKSAPLRVFVDTPRRVGIGEACDERTTVCDPEHECTGTCGPTLARRLACETALASPRTLEAPVGSARSVTEAIQQPLDSEGRFTASCSEARDNPEALLVVDVPMGVRADLVVESEAVPRGSAAIYRRAVCVEPTSEDACAAGDSFDSARLVVEDVSPGLHHLFIDLSGMTWPAPTGVSSVIGLRPLLDPGEACDPEEIENRCAGARCDVSLSRCP